MSQSHIKQIINSSDKRYRRILTRDSHELFPKAFVFFLFQQFNPSTTPMGKKLFCPVNDDEIDLSMYHEVDPSEVSPGYKGDIILLRVQYNECPGDFEYIKDQDIIYSASIPEEMREDTDLIDFLLSYKDDEIVTCGNFTTSFLQKLVGLTFGSVRYTQTFLISLFAQFPPCTLTGKKIWHKSKCNQDGEQRVHTIYIQDEDGLEYTVLSNSRGDTYASDTKKGYYPISSSDILTEIDSIPECVQFIKKYRGDEMYELNQRMNNFRIKHLMTFDPEMIEMIEMIETDEVLFTCRIPGDPRHTFNGNHWSPGLLTFFRRGEYFRIDYDRPSILWLDSTEKPVSSRFGKLSFKPSDWKENPIVSTIIYRKWHLGNIRINSIHPDMQWSIDSEYRFLKVSFPKDKVITELIDLAKHKCTLDECCTFTQRLIKEEVTIEDLEAEYSFSQTNNYELYTLD